MVKAELCIAVILAVALCGKVEGGDSTPSSVRYLCKQGAIEITGIVIATDVFTPARIFSVDAPTTCGSTVAAGDVAFTGSGTTGQPYKATITKAQLQASKCGTQANSPNSFTVKLAVTKSALIITKDDLYTTVSCTSTEKNTLEKTASLTNVDWTPSAGKTITATKDLDVALLVTASVGGATKTTASVGDMVKLKMTLSNTNGLIKKCKIIGCVASGTNSFANAATNAQLIDNNGCTSTAASVYTTNTQKCTEDTSATNKAIYTCPAFAMMQFIGVNTVAFQCTCEGCFQGGNCAPTCGPGRKRRDVNPTNVTTGAAQSVVFIVDKRTSANENEFVESRDKMALSTCMSHVSFISVIAVLSILLLVAMATSIFFCLKLIGHNRSQTGEGKEVYPNGGFKP